MLQELTWDSTVVGRRMGIVKYDSADPDALDVDLIAARAGAYKYLVCKPNIRDRSSIRLLCSRGFYLSDQGVTWAMPTAQYASPAADSVDATVRTALPPDIPELQALMPALFLESRFYNDPFFSKEEADRVHIEWISNSVKGVAADVVLFLPGDAFITCKASKESGDIILIGVREGARGRGLGIKLMTAAMAWFAARGVKFVRVRTQLQNLPAMNFYRRQGFAIHDADIALALILE